MHLRIQCRSRQCRMKPKILLRSGLSDEEKAYAEYHKYNVDEFLHALKIYGVTDLIIYDENSIKSRKVKIDLPKHHRENLVL